MLTLDYPDRWFYSIIMGISHVNIPAQWTSCLEHINPAQNHVTKHREEYPVCKTIHFFLHLAFHICDLRHPSNVLYIEPINPPTCFRSPIWTISIPLYDVSEYNVCQSLVYRRCKVTLTEKSTIAVRTGKRDTMNLMEYILAIIIVILFMIGFVILSVRLRPAEEIHQRPQEKNRLQEALGTDDLPIINNPPKRGLLGIFGRSERTMGW